MNEGCAATVTHRGDRKLVSVLVQIEPLTGAMQEVLLAVPQIGTSNLETFDSLGLSSRSLGQVLGRLERAACIEAQADSFDGIRFQGYKLTRIGRIVQDALRDHEVGG